MKVFYVGDELPILDDQEMYLENSIFLAGPTPRSSDVETWRKEALTILKEIGFEGSVFTPETQTWEWLGHYHSQVEWEWEALGMAEVTLFWVPRHLGDMPAFTTNVEFGFMAAFRPENIVFGCPNGAPKTQYLTTMCKRISRFQRLVGHSDDSFEPIVRAASLRESLSLCVAKVNDHRV